MNTIGRYRIVGELGRGAMGIVFRATDPAIGRTLAIKTIRLGDLSDTAERDRLRERLFREARSAGILSHPHIVTIYDVGQDGDLAYVAMEFVDGPTLEMLLRRPGVIDQELILRVLGETATALDYAHQKGIVHRDIKPPNIMINETGAAKITDFGVAKILSQQMTQADIILGTPSYMSPEQIEAKSIDGRADQFSLAVIAYELLTGEKPFTADTLPSLLFKIVREDAIAPQLLNPSLNAATNEVMRRALSKNKDQRFATCSEMVSALREALLQCPNWKPLARGAVGSLETVVEHLPNQPSPAPGPEFHPEAATIVHPVGYSPPDSSKTVVEPAGTLQPSAMEAPSSEAAAETPAQAASEVAMPDAPVQEAASPEPAPPPSVPPPTQPEPPTQPQPLAAPSRAHHRPRLEEEAARRSPALRNAGIAVAVVVLIGLGVFAALRITGGSSGTPVEGVPTSSAPSGAPAASAASPKPVPIAGEALPATAAGGSETVPPPPPAKPKPDRPPAGPPRQEAPAGPLRLSVTTTPRGATVSLREDPTVACTSPCELELPPGRHVLSVTMAGYRPALRIVNLPQESSLNVTLDVLGATLLLKSEPPGATIILNGKTHSQKTPAMIRLPSGKYKLQLRREGYADYDDSFEIKERDVLLEVNLSRAG